MRRPPTVAALAVAIIASGCAGAEVGARQVPAVLTGRVLEGAPCPPQARTACIGRAVPGALVLATGKDGVHRVPADGGGSYSIALLTGEWTVVATTPDGRLRSTGVQIFLRPSQSVTLDLRVP